MTEQRLKEVRKRTTTTASLIEQNLKNLQKEFPECKFEVKIETQTIKPMIGKVQVHYRVEIKTFTQKAANGN